jgi:hypothetical protein
MLTPTFSPNEPNFLALLQCLVWTGFRERRRVHRRERGRTRRSTSETDQTETAMKSRSRNRQIVSRNSRDHRSQTGLQVEPCIDFALSCENWCFAKRTQFRNRINAGFRLNTRSWRSGPARSPVYTTPVVYLYLDRLQARLFGARHPVSPAIAEAAPAE